MMNLMDNNWNMTSNWNVTARLFNLELLTRFSEVIVMQNVICKKFHQSQFMIPREESTRLHEEWNIIANKHED